MDVFLYIGDIKISYMVKSKYTLSFENTGFICWKIVDISMRMGHVECVVKLKRKHI
ncbi:hypothetical protein ACSHT3_03325 [Clostridium botulinum]|nr:hypothetical protein [Clostridium botulinum]HCL4564554.1 hypothetical protein [Clostridium botulinum]